MPDNPFAHRLPTKRELYYPIVQALRSLGGSASNTEIANRVIADLALPAPLVDALLSSGHTSLENRLSWARIELRIAGFIESSQRGVWHLTAAGREAADIDPREVVRVVNDYYRQRHQEGGAAKPSLDPEDGDDPPPDSDTWRADLLETLRNMPPDAFERLCQRLLRESDFVGVVVTGRSGDGGIDGRGVVRLAGLINFSVAFQCKRYSGSVGPGEVNSFRGAVQGEADRGLFLTTGTFTRSARQAATKPLGSVALPQDALRVVKMRHLIFTGAQVTSLGSHERNSSSPGQLRLCSIQQTDVLESASTASGVPRAWMSFRALATVLCHRSVSRRWASKILLGPPNGI